MESEYFDIERSAAAVAEGKHREIVGGLWEHLGELQFQYMVARGLRPEHRLLDIGCGALRGGVRFVPYLAPGHYFGVDISQDLLDGGYREVVEAGHAALLPRENLRCSAKFEFSEFDQKFDFALAQSVFTHLSFNWIRRCLEQVSDVLTDGGVLYATFFERSADFQARANIVHKPGGKKTYDVNDPYHYSVDDFIYMVKDLPFDVEYIGEWGHPRAQKMLAFKKRSLAVADTDEGVRGLSLSEAASLPAGSNHYRAYVGPPNRFDFMSATQFSLLFTLGLRDHHRVLDFGCGSLRLGRLLVPFLQRDKYYGIEPNAWLIEDAIKFELGRDIVGIKNPKFSENDDFNCSVFGKKFDFIVAQSVVTHCGPDLFQKLIVNFSEVLSDDGIVAFSYWNTEDKLPTPPKDGWHYPSSVKYLEDEVRGFVETAGLVGLPVPWYHPGASWYLAARTRERLPRPEELRFLRGAVLHDEQFVASRNT